MTLATVPTLYETPDPFFVLEDLLLLFALLRIRALLLYLALVGHPLIDQGGVLRRLATGSAISANIRCSVSTRICLMRVAF